MNKKIDVEYIKLEFQKINNYFIARKYQTVIDKTLVLLRKDPNQIVFYNYIGLSYRQLRQFEKAENIFKKGLKIFPRSLTITTNLGSLYREMLRYDDAEKYLSEGLKINGNDFACLSNMANLQRDLNKHDLAIKYYEKAYEINKDNETLLSNLAGEYQLVNNFEKSKKILREIHKKFPTDIKSHFMYSVVHEYKETDDHRNEMLDKLTLSLSTKDKLYLNFALSKSYSDISHYELSAKHCKIANDLQCKLISDYNFDDELHIFNTVKDKFKAIDFDKIDNLEKPNFIFIVGLPRSGTTLTHQIISCHSQIYGAGELPIINKIFRDGVNNKEFLDNFFGHGDIFNNSYIRNIAVNTEKIFRKFSNDIILDKAPINFIWIGFIKLLFPNSKIIHCKRNLRDVALSIYKNYFDGGSMPWGYNEKTLVKYIECYKDIMKFWNDKFPQSIYNLHYENLIDNQVEETKKLIKFCKLDWEESCINYTNNKTAIKTVSIAQARKPIYKTSKNLSDKYLDYLDFLKTV